MDAILTVRVLAVVGEAMDAVGVDFVGAIQSARAETAKAAASEAAVRDELALVVADRNSLRGTVIELTDRVASLEALLLVKGERGDSDRPTRDVAAEVAKLSGMAFAAAPGGSER